MINAKRKYSVFKVAEQLELYPNEDVKPDEAPAKEPSLPEIKNCIDSEYKNKKIYKSDLENLVLPKIYFHHFTLSFMEGRKELIKMLFLLDLSILRIYKTKEEKVNLLAKYVDSLEDLEVIRERKRIKLNNEDLLFKQDDVIEGQGFLPLNDNNPAINILPSKSKIDEDIEYFRRSERIYNEEYEEYKKIPAVAEFLDNYKKDILSKLEKNNEEYERFKENPESREFLFTFTKPQFKEISDYPLEPDVYYIEKGSGVAFRPSHDARDMIPKKRQADQLEKLKEDIKLLSEDEYRGLTESVRTSYIEIISLKKQCDDKIAVIQGYYIKDLPIKDPESFKTLTDMSKHVYQHLTVVATNSIVEKFNLLLFGTSTVSNDFKAFDWDMEVWQKRPGQLETALAGEVDAGEIIRRGHQFISNLALMKQRKLDMYISQLNEYLYSLKRTVRFLQESNKSGYSKVASRVSAIEYRYGAMMDRLWTEYRHVLNNKYSLVLDCIYGEISDRFELKEIYSRKELQFIADIKGISDKLFPGADRANSGEGVHDNATERFDLDKLIYKSDYKIAIDEFITYSTLFAEESLIEFSESLYASAANNSLVDDINSKRVTLDEPITKHTDSFLKLLRKKIAEEITGLSFNQLTSIAPYFNFSEEQCMAIYKSILSKAPENVSSLQSYLQYPKFLYSKSDKKDVEAIQKLTLKFIATKAVSALMSQGFLDKLKRLYCDHTLPRKIKNKKFNPKINFNTNDIYSWKASLSQEMVDNLDEDFEFLLNFDGKRHENLEMRELIIEIFSRPNTYTEDLNRVYDDHSEVPRRKIFSTDQLNDNTFTDIEFATINSSLPIIDFHDTMPISQDLLEWAGPVLEHLLVSDTGYAGQFAGTSYSNYDTIINNHKNISRKNPEYAKKINPYLQGARELIGGALFPSKNYDSRYTSAYHANKKGAQRTIIGYNVAISGALYCQLITLFTNIFKNEFNDLDSNILSDSIRRKDSHSTFSISVSSSYDFKDRDKNVFANYAYKNSPDLELISINLSDEDKQLVFSIYAKIKCGCLDIDSHSGPRNGQALISYLMKEKASIIELLKALPESILHKYSDLINKLINNLNSIEPELRILIGSNIYQTFASNRMGKVNAVGPRSVVNGIAKSLNDKEQAMLSNQSVKDEPIKFKSLLQFLPNMISENDKAFGDSITLINKAYIYGVDSKEENTKAMGFLKPEDVSEQDSITNLFSTLFYERSYANQNYTLHEKNKEVYAIVDILVSKLNIKNYDNFKKLLESINQVWEKKNVGNFSTQELILCINYLFSSVNIAADDYDKIKAMFMTACMMASVKHNNKDLSDKTLLSIALNPNFEHYKSNNYITKAIDLYCLLGKFRTIKDLKEHYKEALENYKRLRMISRFDLMVSQFIKIFKTNEKIRPNLDNISAEDLERQNEIKILVESLTAIMDLMKQFELFKEYNVKSEMKHPQLFNLNWNQEQKYFRFRVLKDLDPLHFRVGDITNCCQRIGGAGEAAAEDSYINSWAGVLLLEIKVGPKWEIAAQSYFHYVDKKNIYKGYILDNVESNKAVFQRVNRTTGFSPEKLYSMLAIYVKNKYPDINIFLCGTGYSKLRTDEHERAHVDGGDPREFAVDNKYTDWSSRSSLNLLKPRFEIDKEYSLKE